MSPKVSPATPTGGLVREISEKDRGQLENRDGNRDHRDWPRKGSWEGSQAGHHDLVTGSNGKS